MNKQKYLVKDKQSDREGVLQHMFNTKEQIQLPFWEMFG